MLRIRLVEERIAVLYPEQEMRCPVHLCIGQEAVAAGVCAVLERRDVVMSGHRAHGHYLAKGGNLKRMMAELFGKAAGCSAGFGGSMHLVDREVNFLGSTPIVASIVPVATGVAWAAKLSHAAHVTVVFTGEAAVEEGVWHESLNFAALRQLPIIYTCENNLYSVYTPLTERQPDRPLAGLAAAHGVAAWRGDGNDVEAVFELARQARDRVLSGGGPVFLEFATYRWREHCGPNYDNDLGYRSQEEFETWRARDPLRRLERDLRAPGVTSRAKLVALRHEIEREIDEAVAFAKQSPWPQQVSGA
ncbi:MAG: thiamine pyrophosphate-dependent dehydrogenase E1 component subunit alpha [Candidatus Andersenbacteria bacterium]|nr:thiamine pyrophosphate-dependent dehydrogenase E1 component subunit alpha [Candidatus Andersenbacteria bacterium]